MGRNYEFSRFPELPGALLSQFVQYKQALNRKYRADAEVLRLFDRYLKSPHIADWSAIDSALIDDFLKSRPRASPRSYNHLLGVVHRFFAFARRPPPDPTRRFAFSATKRPTAQKAAYVPRHISGSLAPEARFENLIAGSHDLRRPASIPTSLPSSGNGLPMTRDISHRSLWKSE
jgi:hypothetical protein